METGYYRHYKGKVYLVLGIGKNSETLEDMVVYQAMYDDPKFGNKVLWLRPLSMFLEQVKVDDKLVPRFSKLSSGECSDSSEE